MWKKIKSGVGQFAGFFNLKKKVGGWLVGFGTGWLLGKINGYLVKLKKGGDLEAVKKDINMLLVVAEALDAASTIAIKVLKNLASYLADDKLTKKELTSATKMIATAGKNYKALMKK